MNVFKEIGLTCEPLKDFADHFCIELSETLHFVWLLHRYKNKELNIRKVGSCCKTLWSDHNGTNIPQFSNEPKSFKESPIFREIIRCFKLESLIGYLFDSTFLLIRHDNGSFEAIADGPKLNFLLTVHRSTSAKVAKLKRLRSKSPLPEQSRKKFKQENSHSLDLFERKVTQSTKTKRKLRKKLTEPVTNIESHKKETISSEPYLDHILYNSQRDNSILKFDDVDGLLRHIIQLPIPVGQNQQLLMSDEWFTSSKHWLQLRSLLETFLKNEAVISSNPYGYRNILNKHLKCIKHSEEGKCAPINKKTIVSYVCDLLRRTVPSAFFSNSNRHRKTFSSIVSQIIQGQRYQHFSLNAFLRCFDADCAWKQEMAPLFQRYMPIKLVKFFVVDYILHIVKNLFYVTECGSNGFNLYFYNKSEVLKKLVQLRDRWSQCKRIVKCDPTANGDESIRPAKIRLLPKRPDFNEFRVITIVHSSNKEKSRRLNRVGRMLDGLLSCYGTGIKPLSSNPRLHEAWTRIRGLKDESDCPIYYVKADIVDAFGSVIHEKLMEALEYFCPGGETHRGWKELLIKEWCYRRGKVQLISRYSFSRKLYDNRVLCSRKIANQHTTSVIFKQFVHHMVCKQYLKIGRQLFLLTAGLTQGGAGPLSNRLCDLYYSAMDIAYFSQMTESGDAVMLRGTDDYLFVTSNKGKVEQFLRIIKQGIPKYGAIFNSQKMRTNFFENHVSVTYLGLDFNFQNFSVEPNYERYNNSFLNFIKLNISSHDTYLSKLNFLSQRSFKWHVLKLTPIVRETNLNNPILVAKVCSFYAYRTLALALYLRPTTADLMFILSGVAKRFQKLFAFNVLRIYWVAVYNAFIKHSSTFNGISNHIKLKLVHTHS